MKKTHVENYVEKVHFSIHRYFILNNYEYINIILQKLHNFFTKSNENSLKLAKHINIAVYIYTQQTLNKSR